MSSHREVPEISKDPVADNTDVYAFVSPDRPDMVTLIANFIPFQSPQGGPNFYEFGGDVLDQIHVSNRGDARTDVVYQFRFHTKIRNDATFLDNTGPINKVGDASWNRPQFSSVTKLVRGGSSKILVRDLACPPVNVGTRSTPNYAHFTADLGSIFDLGALRQFQMLHLIPSAAAAGVNGAQGLNVHSIALQVPISDLTATKNAPKDVADPASVIGVWATASRRRHDDRHYAKYVTRPELAGLLPVLYPGVSPELAAYNTTNKPRADLVAILLTGIPNGIVPGFQNYTGKTQADMVRLNVAIPPTRNKPNPLGWSRATSPGSRTDAGSLPRW